MLNITAHQGNAIRNTLRFYLTPVRILIIKRQGIINADENVEKREHGILLVGIYIGIAAMENSMEVSHKKIKKTISYNVCPSLSDLLNSV